MIIQKYLVISVTKGRYGLKKSKVELKEREPKLKGNEISLRLALDIPDVLFDRPKLDARIAVPKEARNDITVTPEITTNIEKIVKDATGLDIHINVIEHD